MRHNICSGQIPPLGTTCDMQHRHRIPCTYSRVKSRLQGKLNIFCTPSRLLYASSVLLRTLDRHPSKLPGSSAHHLIQHCRSPSNIQQRQHAACSSICSSKHQTSSSVAGRVYSIYVCSLKQFRNCITGSLVKLDNWQCCITTVDQHIKVYRNTSILII